MSYIYPCVVHNVSDSFQDHVNRGSVNPGTDYTAAFGSEVRAIASGRVTDVTRTFGGSGGRMVHIDHDDGSSADYLHLSRMNVIEGEVVRQGDLIAWSGASGNGLENYYGAHLHISFRRNKAQYYNNGNVDFDAIMRAQGSAIAGGGGTPLVPIVRKDSDMPNVWWTTDGTGWFGSVAVTSMDHYNVLVRYWNSTPAKADKFNAVQRDWIKNYLGLNNAYGIPKPVMPTFDTAALAKAVADSLKAAKLTTVADPESLKAPLDAAFSRALSAWTKSISDTTKSNIGFEPSLLANAVAQELQKTGVVTTVDTKAVESAVSSALARATQAIATATAKPPTDTPK